MWESFSAGRCRGEFRQSSLAGCCVRFVSSSFDVFCLLAVKRRLLLRLPKQTPHQATLIGRHDVASLRPRFAERFLSNSLRFARNIPTCATHPRVRAANSAARKVPHDKRGRRGAASEDDRSILLSRPNPMHTRKRKLEKNSTTRAEETRATRAGPLASSQAMGCQPSFAKHLPFTLVYIIVPKYTSDNIEFWPWAVWHTASSRALVRQRVTM